MMDGQGIWEPNDCSRDQGGLKVGYGVCWGLLLGKNLSWSKTRMGSEFKLEWSYQVSEEGNRIGLGFKLCVAPP